jgi:hypothetical protein
MTRFRVLLSLALFSLLLAAAADAQRRRAVRAPAPQCSYSLVQGWGAAISPSGAVDAQLRVVASPSTCTSWNAYSLASWVTVERSGDFVLVDVAPNPTGTERTATLLVAGIKHTIVQDASSVISPPIEGTLLRNGGFDTDLSFWGWQDRFPNGTGSADWSALDGTGKPSSGSIRLRNTRPTNEGPAYQQLQCAAVEAGKVYEYGFRFFATSTTAGSAVLAVVEYADEGCTTAAIAKETRTKTIRTPGAWQSEDYDIRFGTTTRSVLVVIGAFASPGNSYEVFVDDVFLKKR